MDFLDDCLEDCIIHLYQEYGPEIGIIFFCLFVLNAFLSFFLTSGYIKKKTIFKIFVTKNDFKQMTPWLAFVFYLK